MLPRLFKKLILKIHKMQHENKHLAKYRISISDLVNISTGKIIFLPGKCNLPFLGKELVGKEKEILSKAGCELYFPKYAALEYPELFSEDIKFIRKTILNKLYELIDKNNEVNNEVTEKITVGFEIDENNRK